MSTIQEPSIAQIPAWKREGLPGIPAVWEVRDGDNPKWVPLEDLLRDADGKVITAPRGGKADKLLSRYLEKTVEVVSLLHPGITQNISYESFADAIAFRCNEKVSCLERHAAATLAWLSNNYYPPIERREKIVFPTLLASIPEKLRSPRHNVLLYKALTKKKAHQAADVLETIFVGIKTNVFEDGDGWFISIDEKRTDCKSIDDLQCMETILFVLSYFDVTPIESEMESCYESFDEVPKLQKYFDRKADRVKALNASQQRIEDGINAILAHLGHPEAEGDAHTLPEPKQSPASKEKASGKKPSGKGKPKAGA